MIDFDGKTRVVGIGSALVDLLSHQDDDFVRTLGSDKGGMTLVDGEFIDRALTAMDSDPSMVPGGSACNTIVGLGRLGTPSRFIGKLGDDKYGREFEQGLRGNRVEPVFARSQTPTGRVLSLITPDAQRTMFTYLGASAELAPVDIRKSDLNDAAIVYLEGYLLFNADLTLRCVQAAKEVGAKVCLDLASYTVVRAAGDMLKELVHDYVDILLANEDEAREYTGLEDEGEMLAALASEVEIAALKVGARGSLIAAEDDVTVVPPAGEGEVIDTTGAGDLWASGFVHGLLSGRTIADSGRIASLCGWEVCRVVGAQIPDEGWQRILTNS